MQCEMYSPRTERTCSEEKGFFLEFLLIHAIYRYLLHSSETSMKNTHQNTDGGHPQSGRTAQHSVLFRYAKMNRGYFPSSFFVS